MSRILFWIALIALVVMAVRSKLRAAGQAHWVENLWGVGYRLAPVGLLESEPSTT